MRRRHLSRYLCKVREVGCSGWSSLALVQPCHSIQLNLLQSFSLELTKVPGPSEEYGHRSGDDTLNPAPPAVQSNAVQCSPMQSSAIQCHASVAVEISAPPLNTPVASFPALTWDPQDLAWGPNAAPGFSSAQLITVESNHTLSIALGTQVTKLGNGS